MKINTKIILSEESYNIYGAIYEVHKVLGCGFLEKVYQEALEEEFKQRNIPFQREKQIKISYKDKVLQQAYIADFVCYDKIIVELKAVDKILDIHKTQLLNYLKATGMSLGILVNFNEEYVVPHRVVNG